MIALILIQLQKKTNLPGDALLGLLAHSSLAVGLVVIGFLTVVGIGIVLGWQNYINFFDF